MGTYFSFVAFATLVAIAPGPDTLLTMRNTMTRGRPAGLWTMAGVSLSGSCQGLLAAAGLGAIIVHAEPVFETIRWLGVCYLVWLGVTALLAAWRADGVDWTSVPASLPRGGARRMFGQGLLCNATNPKVLAFNLAVLPQFVGTGASSGVLVAYALTLTVVGAMVLLAVVYGASSIRHLIARRKVQRSIEAGTGVAMLGFATALALEDH